MIAKLREISDSDGESLRVGEWMEVLYDQALIAEGSPVDDPAKFAKRLTSLLGEATLAAAK